MERRWILLGFGAVLSFCAAGCGAADERPWTEEELGSVGMAQIDPGYNIWRKYTVRFTNTEVLATILAINDKDIGDFHANTEYFSVNTQNLKYLGGLGLVFEYEDGDDPPVSGEGDQEFTQPLYANWVSFSSDPVQGGSLYDQGNVHLRIDDDSSAITRLTWYQTIPPGIAPVNVTPSGIFKVGTGSVRIPNEQRGYYVDLAVH